MVERDLPLVTVVISTRGRAEIVANSIQTILLNDYPHFEVIVVDQSEDGLTETALQPALHDPRIRYIRSATEGPSAGRNIGISEAQSEFIAITDDDCEVSTNWLRQLVAAFAVDSRIGIVFGNVLPGPHDSASGFIPAYVRNGPCLARSMGEKNKVEGISACIGLRRSMWQALGGFDHMLGAGAQLKSGAESDLTIRALLNGYFVYETPSVTVIHHGFRTWKQGRTIIHRYWYGTGAMLVKHVKCGHWSVIHLLLCLAWRWAFGRSLVAASLGRYPHRLLRLTSFVRGFVAGSVTPVDRTTGHYVCGSNDGDRSEVGTHQPLVGEQYQRAGRASNGQ